ncbi:P-loop containing nucleoside triphosphate hydrolase protein [Exidia glandulosa HHB12029]|uniref:p-loop containing nucleoside triphosphate hydrolase protein n=1 Tax=Exidia glandulosa HHB12029 TaxID=1314781 RepID=A0A165MZJ2_EXIGL|nr:P-loop containing nucleoside triphosphate hydrolase protein [Exidia glandulosa HHB12029]
MTRSFIPSPEQTAVIEHCRHSNVVVAARPGSGKTATAEALVQANPSVPIAVVTYSKRLQISTQTRLADYAQADAFTFHGLASRLFGEVVHTDNLLRNLRQKKTPPTWTNMPDYRYVILDELQDMTSDLYWLSCTFITALTRRNGTAPNLLILGDQRQAIYEFRGADARYLTLTPDIFSAMSPYSWERLQLAQSFRLSHQTASFVNNAFLGGDEYIKGSHDGRKPLYVHADLSNIRALIDVFLPLIHEYGPENTAIIAPFVRNHPFLPHLCNALSNLHSIPIAVSTSDDISLDADVLNGKLAVTTYHQFKGSERRCVIVYGADASYFNFMGRDLPDDQCPNATFVALTRARDQLVVVQNSTHPAMPFVNWDAVHQYADYVNLDYDEPRAQYEPGRPLRLGLLLPQKVLASQCARHVRDEELDALVHENVQILELVGPSPYGPFDDVPEKVCTNASKNHHEVVSDLNGLVVTAALEFSLQHTLASLGFENSKRGKGGTPADIPTDPRERAVWLMKAAVQYEAKTSGYRSRLVQMKDQPFDWFAEGGLLDLAAERLQTEVASGVSDMSQLQFEHSMSTTFKIGEEETKLSGRSDILYCEERGKEVHTTIWEVKFVTALSQEHVVQAVVYGYLWTVTQPKTRLQRHPIVHFPRLVLFNVRTGAKWEIKTTQDRARSLIEGVLREKYTSKGESAVDEFLKDCATVVKSVEKNQRE